MSTVSGRVLIDIAIREVLSSVGGDFSQTGPVTHAFQQVRDLANGTLDGQINKVYSEVVTGIAASTTTQRDLVGTLTDKDGAVINFDEVVLLFLFNLSSTAANYLTLGPGAATPFGVVTANKGFWSAQADKNVIPADGESFVLLWSKSGIPAAGGSTDRIDIITQSGTSANTWILIAAGRDN